MSQKIESPQGFEEFEFEVIQDPEDTLYNMEEEKLRHILYEVSGRAGLDPIFLDHILDFSRKQYAIEGHDLEELRLSRKSNSKSDYFSHITRIILRDVILGVKNYYQFFLEGIHDVAETQMALARKYGINIRPETIFTNFERELEEFNHFMKKRSYDLEDMLKTDLIDISHGHIILTRPFIKGRGEEGTYYEEDKEDKSYLHNIYERDENKIISPKYYKGNISPFNLGKMIEDTKTGDKIDVADKPLLSFPIHKQIRQLEDFDLIVKLSKDKPDPEPTPIRGMHDTYTTEFYPPLYASRRYDELKRKRNIIEDNIEKNYNSQS